MQQTTNYSAPFPDNEINRVLNLSGFNLDYSALQNDFKHLTKLAAKIAGADISLLNLIDSYTQWTVSYSGFEIEQMWREESVCQYTILEDSHFEVENLAADERFKDKFYVKGEPSLRYYYGIPLKYEGYSIGSLCVLDKKKKVISPANVELLKIIGDEIVNRLSVYKTIQSLRTEIAHVKTTQSKVMHDIRGPLGGIIGLSEIIADGGLDSMDKVLEFNGLINKCGNTILELSTEILNSKKPSAGIQEGRDINLVVFKEKLEKLYMPQAKSKGVSLAIGTSAGTELIEFPKNRLLQIAGNLISNAIKFTPDGGGVLVTLNLTAKEYQGFLRIVVQDTGIGLSQRAIDNIAGGSTKSTNGTEGERGYGMGLTLVKHLTEELQGTFKITSAPGEGSTFEVSMPLYIA